MTPMVEDLSKSFTETTNIQACSVQLEIRSARVRANVESIAFEKRVVEVGSFLPLPSGILTAVFPNLNLLESESKIIRPFSRYITRTLSDPVFVSTSKSLIFLASMESTLFPTDDTY